MDENKKQEKESIAHIDNLNNSILKKKDERENTRKSLEELKTTLQQKFIKQNTARLNVIKEQERKNEAEEGYGNLQLEEKDIDNQLLEITSQKEQIKNELRDSEEREKEEEKTIADNQILLEDQRILESSQSNQVSELDLEVEKMLQKQGFHQQNVDRIQVDILKLEEEISHIQEGLNANALEVERKKENIFASKQTIDAYQTAHADS